MLKNAVLGRGEFLPMPCNLIEFDAKVVQNDELLLEVVWPRKDVQNDEQMLLEVV